MTTPETWGVKKGIKIFDSDGNPISSSHPLFVELVNSEVTLTVGDIEIGAVEGKDATTDTRWKIKSDGVDNALVMMQNSQPLPSGASTEDTLKNNLEAINSLTPSKYDYIELSYTDSNLTGVIYKSGGSGGTTVSTLTLAYTDGNLVSVTKS